jgi:hypothetical protein
MILSKKKEDNWRLNFEVMDQLLNASGNMICVNVHELFT